MLYHYKLIDLNIFDVIQPIAVNVLSLLSGVLLRLIVGSYCHDPGNHQGLCCWLARQDVPGSLGLLVPLGEMIFKDHKRGVPDIL